VSGLKGIKLAVGLPADKDRRYLIHHVCLLSARTVRYKVILLTGV